MLVVRQVVLLCSIFFCLSSAKTPKEGASCTAEGRTGKCVVWNKCAPIAEIIRRKPPQVSELIYIEKFICGYKRNTPYYCCVEAPPPQNKPEAHPPQNEGKPNSSEEIKDWEQNPLLNHNKRNLLPLNTCGLIVHNHIVGGEKADLGEFPWLAIIHYKHTERSGQFMCGGVLINKRYVLTAAHCLHRDKLFGFYPDMVRLGEHNLETDPDIEYGKEGRQMVADPVMDFMIEKIIIHKRYNASNLNQFHDIGLIRLSSDAPETRYVKSICLPNPKVDKQITRYDAYLQVAGWGNTGINIRSRVLMKVAIPTEDLKTCAEKYSYLQRNVTHKQLCAGMRGKDSCKGDSGGPLMGLGKYAHLKYTRYFAVGLVSYGHVDCGVHDLPGVYTRVLPYVNWILENIMP